MPRTESDLAFRMRTTRSSAHFPCRLLAMPCHFPNVSLFTIRSFGPAYVDVRHNVSGTYTNNKPLLQQGMSISKPGEMASERSKAVVLPKFDMHVITSDLTSDELKTVVDEYAIPEDLHPQNYDETDVARISEFLVPLQPPPRHLLYVCGLTTACRHPELRNDIKDKGKNAEAKCVGADAGGAGGSRKKRKIQKKDDSFSFLGSEGPSVGHPSQAIPLRLLNTMLLLLTPKVAKVVPDVEKVVVNLSGNTRMSTPLVEVNQPSPPRQHDNTQVSPHLDGIPFASSHGDESLVDKYVPNWGLRSDLRIFTPGACKELVSHLATPAEDEFLGGLSNADIVGHAYLTLGQSVVTQGDILKRHEQLRQYYVDLQSFGDVQS
ncbi:hypothetical protein Tco_1127369 [Tanacetum coccineum]